MKKFIPNKECLQKLNEAAKDIYAHRFNQLGYPFNQETDLSEFYQWLVDTKLADLTLINVGDPYKTDWDMLNTDYFEQKAIDFIAESFGFDENHWGVIANGGTDGNMHGIYFGRKALAAKSNLPPILYVSKEAHYSLKKIGDIQNIEVRTINAHEMGEMDTQDFADKLDTSRPALVAIAIGGTFKGAIDNQKEIDAVLKAKKPVAYYRHLDVALFGGYLPYLDNKEANNIVNAAEMDFDSIAVSGHKFLSLNEPAGIFVCHKDILNCVSNTPIPYLKGVIPTISCSRSGFDALKLYWRLMSVGKNGLKEQANHSMAMAVLLEEELKNANVKAWRNKFSNTVFFERPKEEIVKKYALACNDDEHFGKLSHIVAMQYFDEKLIKQIVADIAKK